RRRGDAPRRLGGHLGPARGLPALRRGARGRGRRPRPALSAPARPPGAGRLDRPRPGVDQAERARHRRGSRAHEPRARLGRRARDPDDDHGLAHDQPARLALLAQARLPHDVPAPVPLDPVVPATRVPLLYGSRLVVATPPEDAVVVAPPPPPDGPIADVGAAVRDALRFPLAGEPLESIVTRGGRVTIVAELPSLPIPGTQRDPRQVALRAAADELERIGVPAERQTILVATGLSRRPGRRGLESLVTPEFALRFRGEVAVHDAEDPALVDVGEHAGVPLRVHPSLVRTDAVVTGSAAGTVLHGGPGVLVAAAGAETQRAATADSLLETRLAPGWELALAIGRAGAARVPLIGASLTLDLPRLSGALRGYPYEEQAVERVTTSRLARALRLLPASVRMRALASLPLELTASATFAGPPSVAHAEALLRGVETGSASLDEPVDAICLGVPRTTPYLPRERPNALLATTLGLGYALRLWRDAFPVREGGTAILVSPFRRRFTHPTQQPYRTFFQATRA